MARLQVLPTDTIREVCRWVNLNDAAWQAMSTCLGGIPDMRIFATLPKATLLPAFERSRIPATASQPERLLTAVEIIQIGLVWRICRQAYSWPDVDPLIADTPVHTTPTGGVTPTSAGGSHSKRVKMSSAVDQLDDSEVEVLGNDKIDECYRNYREAVGSDPMADADPSVEQITAMYMKVLRRQEAPYADFSFLTPFGRRAQKQSKAHNAFLQQYGTWKTVEIPGPPTFSAWSAC